MATHCLKAKNNISLMKKKLVESEIPRCCSIWKTITEFVQRSKVKGIKQEFSLDTGWSGGF